MKKIVFLALIICSLMACKTSTEEDTKKPEETPAVPTDNVRVRNSAWQIVKSDYLEKLIKGLPNITSLDGLEKEIAAYNAENTDDQWFLEEGEQVPIEEAPEATVYIVDTATLEIYFQAVIERTDLQTRRDAWRSTVEVWSDPVTGALIDVTLYVDNVPPEPPVIVPPAPRLWVALLDMTAEKVYYSEHYATEAEAIWRYQMGLTIQAEVYNLQDVDDGIDVPGDVWQAYIGETEYSF